MLLLPGTLLGPYEVIAKLGEGGMGEVYRARDIKLDRDVALKILPESFASDPDRLMRFEREAKSLASLNHPNIAAIYGIEDRALVMELVDGEDLSARIARGAIPLDEALPLAKQIAEALEAAHEQGIIHRDLKPANIKVRADGTVKVLDFGLAKAMDSVPGGRDFSPADNLANSPTITSPAMTVHGVILGTAAYMSPEQAKGKAVDKRADIWAFGVVLYEMLTGHRAFQGEDVSDLLVAVLSKDVDLGALPPGTPRSIVTLIRSCLERDPKNRRRDIGDARLEVTAALAGSDVPERDNTVTGSRHDSNRWRRVSLALAAVSAVLAVTVALLFAYRPAPAVIDSPVLRFGLVDNPALRANTTSTQPFAVSRAGNTIVFSADAGTGVHLWVRTLDRPEPRMLAGTEGGHQPSISPDGEWIAFVAANHVIRKIRVSGGAVTTLIALDDLTAALAWASDEIVLFEKLASSSGIHQVSANGGPATLLIPLAEGEALHRRPFVLHGSRLVFYSSVTPDERTTLAAFSLDDGRRARLEIDGMQALGMIAGHLVYARSDGALMAVPFDASAIRVLGTSEAVQVTRGEPREMRLQGWADARVLVYARGDELWTTPVDGSAAPRMLVDIGAAVLGGASMLPGGQSIVVSRRVRSAQGTLDREELVRIPLVGDTTPRPLIAGTSAGGTMRAIDPRVSPDGRWLAVQDRNQTQIHVRAVDGGVGVQVSDAGGELPVWSHDSRRLFYRTSAGLMVAELQTQPVLAVVRRQRGPAFPAPSVVHDVSADGKTFLLTVPVDPLRKVLVTVNWAADVRKQLRTRESQP